MIVLEKLNFYLFFHIKKPGCSYQAVFLPLLYLPCVVGRKAFSQAIRKFLQCTRLWGEKTVLMYSFNAVAHYGRHQLRDSSMAQHGQLFREGSLREPAAGAVVLLDVLVMGCCPVCGFMGCVSGSCYVFSLPESLRQEQSLVLLG